MKELETCVLCGEVLSIDKNLPIDCRENFIIGCGQLCEDCAHKLKIEEQAENTVLLNSQIGSLVREIEEEEK